MKELIGNYVVISFVISEIASKDVKYDNLQSIARFHWAGLPDEKQRGLYKMLEEGWRNELTAQGLWPLTGREADNHPSDVARWLERSDG